MNRCRFRTLAPVATLVIAALFTGCARTPEVQTTGAARANCDETRGAPRAPDPVRSLSNPVPATMENLAEGRALYELASRPVPCAECHGIAGDGQGPLARHLDPKPSNFTCGFYVDVPDGQLFWSIREGSNFTQPEHGHGEIKRPGRRITAMRPHRYDLTERETWQLVTYLRTFRAEDD